MSDFKKYVENKRKRGEKILSIFLTAGFPDPDMTLPLLKMIEEAGADLIELGVPFSDPQADGATIQEASYKALQHGASLEYALAVAEAFKKTARIPLILMGYANPFFQYGWEKVIARAKKAGIAGYIIPDLPPDESEMFQVQAHTSGQSLVYLVSPNTADSRIKYIDSVTDSFIYAVSLTGVTGARNDVPQSTLDYLKRLEKMTKSPVLVGFGVSTSETAKLLSRHCDGVIIGSAIIKLIAQCSHLDDVHSRVGAFVMEIKKAMAVG